MSALNPPPLYSPLIDDEEGKPTLPWTIFLNQLYEGDTGESWTPTFTGLTETGTPTITGRYYRLGRIVKFFITIVPDTDTTAVAGTTYVNNFPLVFAGDGVVFAVSGNLGDGPGHIVASNNRIYTPAWTAVTVPLTLVGEAELSI